jgi:HD-GYP domain-containing protein (c-di-GMP phosphodiesterase class II)
MMTINNRLNTHKEIFLSNIVILSTDENISFYYQSVIKGLYEWESLILKSPDAFFSQSKPIDLLLIHCENEESESIIKYCIGHIPKIPCIIIGDEDQISKAKLKFKTQVLLDYFTHQTDIEKLSIQINRMTQLQERSRKKMEFCKVNISFFFSTKSVFCDIYLKVNDKKYIKIFNRFDQIEFKDIKKYNNKNIQYLYVRENDFSSIMKKLLEELRPIFESDSHALVLGSQSLNSSFSIQLQETVSESIQKLGLSGEAVEMANLAINSTLNLVEDQKEIYSVLEEIIKGNNYVSEHSFLLTYIGCSILAESPYAHPDNNLAISVSAFFHDIYLQDEEQARIQNKEEFRFKTLGITERDEVLEHPQKASKLVSKIDGIPPESQVIILQHHENYNGTGFPNGIDFKNMSPLSAIFNVAHELASYVYDSGRNPENIEDIVRDLAQTYTRGNYKMAIQAAQKVFLKSSTPLLEKKKVG